MKCCMPDCDREATVGLETLILCEDHWQPIKALNNRFLDQHRRNLEHFGREPVATLILEVEDQVAKLRDAFLHRPDNQVQRRIVNIGSLLYAIAAAPEIVARG